MILGIIGWVVLGLIVGFVATKVVDLHGEDPRLGVAVTAGAAVVAGILYALLSGNGVAAWDPWGLLFAAIGAVVGAVAWHAVRSRYVSRDRYVPRSSR